MSESPEGFDPSALRVNFTEGEAEAVARSPLPVGRYKGFVTKVDPRQSQSEKNHGKWYYSVEMTVNGGDKDGQKAWTNAMLFEGALYTISQLMKACGFPVSQGELEIPGPEAFVGKEVLFIVGNKPASIGTGTKENPQYPAGTEIKGFEPLAKGSVGGKGGKKGSALLPS
jgi:hypothetical protein